MTYVLPPLPVRPPTIDLGNVFSGSPANNQFVDYSKFSPGYVSSNIDNLIQAASRKQAVAQARINDFHLPSQDPNFSRDAPQITNILNNGAGNLALATVITTLLQGANSMMGVSEIFPSNIRAGVLNFNGVQNSGIPVLPAVQQNSPFTSISTMVLNDIKSFFGGSSKLSFAAITAMALAVGSMSKSSTTKNNSISIILGVALNQILPNSAVGVLATESFRDTLTNYFNGDTTKVNAVASTYSQIINNYTTNTTVSTMVNDTSLYDNVPLTIQDPYGLNTRDSFREELEIHYSAAITKMVSDTASPLGLSSDIQTEILDMLTQDVTSQMNDTFRGSIGLPALSVCAEAIKGSARNSTIEAMSRAFNMFSSEIITNAGISPSSDASVAPFDYLINVKKFLQTRMDFAKIGVTNEKFEETEAYLKTVIKNKDLTEQNLKNLNDYLDDLLAVK